MFFRVIRGPKDPDPYHCSVKSQILKTVFRMRIRMHVDPFEIAPLDPDPDPYWEYGSGSKTVKLMF